MLLLDCSKLTGAKALMTVMWKGVRASTKPLDDLRETALHSTLATPQEEQTRADSRRGPQVAAVT